MLNALHRPKRFRCTKIENGGSSIIAALTETGSKMDEVIFEEFGTGNMELNWIDELRTDVSPAIDLVFHTRDDLLLDENTIQRM